MDEVGGFVSLFMLFEFLVIVTWEFIHGISMRWSFI